MKKSFLKNRPRCIYSVRKIEVINLMHILSANEIGMQIYVTLCCENFQGKEVIYAL